MTNVTPSRHQYFINDKTIEELDKEIDAGNDARFKKFLNILSNDAIEHPFMQHSPRLCCKLVPLINKELQQGKISKADIDKVLLQFTKNLVFTKGQVAEDVVIRCKNGATVEVNASLLGFASDFFKAMLASSMKEGVKKDHGKFEIDFTEYESASIEAMKAYVYTGKFSAIQDIGVLVELYTLSRQMLSKPLEKYCEGEIVKRGDSVKTSAELEKIVTSFAQVKAKNKLLIDLELTALKSYLRQEKINFSPSREEGFIQLDVSHLGLLADPGALGTLLMIHTNGLLIGRQDQLEEIDLLLFMPENTKEQFREVTFNLPPKPELVTHLAEQFPNITHVTRPFTFTAEKKAEFHQCTIFIVPLLSLKENQANFHDLFPKLESMHYLLHNMNHLADEVHFAYRQDSDALKTLVPATFTWNVQVYSNRDQLPIEFCQLRLFENYFFEQNGLSGRVWESTQHFAVRWKST